MAAIDLERGLEHRGQGWGPERPELMDNFDSEMQEWEDQLQDIQRKIEELYNEVQARRGANDTSPDNRKEDLTHHGNGLFVPGHHSQSRPGVPPQYGGGYNYNPNGYGCPGPHQNGYGYCNSNGVSEIGDLLQDYLGQGKQMGRKTNGARHVHFSDTIKVSQDNPVHKEEVRRRYENDRFGPEQFRDNLEEIENRKNQVSHMKSSPRRESSPNKENTGSKPPLGQRDSPALHPRSHQPLPESPALDRKCYGPGVLGDRKCGSPSVLRKFGAMLQENEGKLLTESGVVAPQGLAPEPKCPTPGCQRRALGANTAAGRAPSRMPSPRCQADSDALTAESEASQEWGLVSDSGRQNHKDLRGGYGSPKGSHPSPQPSPRRSQVPGSPKVRPRSNSGAERDGGRKPASQHVEHKVNYRVSGGSPGAQRNQRAGLALQESSNRSQMRDEGLIELLDMLDIQHEFGSSSRMSLSAQSRQEQVNTTESPAVKAKRSFSRPARPANQRPPSRWAGHTPPARIMAPSGPIYRPPSPMTSRPPSPAPKHYRPPISYSLQTETVIM